MYNKRSVLEFQDFTNDEEFQNLLRELVVHEPNIREADIYGTRGFKQYGIDILAIESNGVGFAIQAKCYKKFTISDLNKTYDEFKKHVKYWQNQNLRTFVIAISCKVEDPKILKRVNELREDLFKAAQISLIFWQAATIAGKLKYHRKIAEKYIDNTTIVDLLCGKDPIEQAAFLAYKERDRLQLFSAQTQQWRDESSRHEYEHVLHLIRLGQRPSALQTLKAITEARDWISRSSASQAAFLRLTAQLHLAVEKDDVAARAAAETANRLDPEHPDEQVAIQILVSQGHKDQALAQALTFTTDSGRLQAAALLLASDPQRSLDLLSQIHAPDQAVPVVRLRAIALALTGQVAEALTVIERQAQQAPDHYQLHLTWAQLLYFSVLSPAFRTIDRLQTVLPISQGLLQLNEQGIERLQTAQDISARLLTLPNIDPELRNDTALLHLATLTQHPQPDRQFQATTFLQNEIKAGRLTPEEALWAIHYHWPLDLHLHLSALEQSTNPNGPLAVMAWHEQQGHAAEALALLERHEARLRQADPTIVEHWLHRLQPAPPASAMALLTRALAGREVAVTQLDAFLAGEGELGDALQVLQRSNQPALLDRAPELITRVATPAVVALCVETAVNQKQYLLAERLWVEHTELMDGAVLPGHLRRALSRMWFELGKLPEALEDAQLLAEAEPTAYHQMHLIDLMVNAALTADLRPKLTRLLECADLTVTQGLRALRYAQAIQESRLAQRLLLVAAHNIKNDLEVEYVMQAQLMGNFPTMPAVASRFQTLLAEGKTQLFTLINVEDFLAQTQLQNDGYKVYEQGDVSLHHLHSQEPVEFACAYLEARPHLPLYIRHGGLTVSVREDGPPELQGVTTLAMDLTSLLLAARLKVLDLLSQEFEIAVATDHVRDLTYMLADLPSTSDLRAVLQDLLSWIREQHEQNRLTYKPSPEDRRHDHSAEILGLAALVVPAATASERLCLDDRWAQQMALQNRRLVTDLVSVLDALVQRGRFSETAYFQAVHQLRRAGMRFLPITARELLHWLRAAEVQDGRLRETDDLALLRQYYAGCFGAASPLQPITVQGTNDLHIGEMPFLLRYLHETKQALKDVFKSERSPVALANWMFEHLLIDMVAVGELPWGRHPHGRSVNQLRELELLDLASFDVTMTPQSKEAYYKWINRTLLQPRLTLDPELQDRFVAIWKDHLLNLLGPQTTAIHRAALAHLANGTESYVPVLHDAVASDVQYMKSTGRRRIHLCQINGRSFDMGKIWNAFNTLHGFPGRTTQIKDREGMQWTWSLDDDDGVCLLAVNDEGEGFRIRIQEMWLALDTRKEREAHLPEILQALPGISPTDPRVSAMLRARPLDARLDQLADLKSSIPDFFYSALFSALQEKPLDREWNRSNFLPDDPLVILQFVGLEALVHEPDRPFQDVIEAAACSLLERDGPKTTAARFAGLPIALPEVIRRAFLQDVSTFANLRDDLRHQRKSPFGLAHTVRLLKDYPEQEAARLRKRLAASMLQGTYLQDIIAFHRVLRWTYEQIQFRAPTWPAPAFMAASWVHTHEIYSQLREIGYPPDSIWQIFDHDRTFLPLRALLHHPDELSDICMPSHMTPLRTVMLNTLYAADDLLEELRHLFAEILLAPSVEGSDVRLLKNVLIGTEISLPNHLNSFLGRNIELALRHPDWAVFSLLNSEAPKLIFELQKTTEAKNLMQPVVLHLTGRQKPHPMRHNEDFCASVMEFDIQSWQPEQIMTGLIGAAQLTAQTEGTIEPKLLNDLTLVLNTTAPDRALAMQTFEILVALITHPKYRNQELRHLATLLDQVVTPHDQLRTALFPVVLRFAFECPAETASVFWPVLLRWRELGQTRQLDWWAELGGAEFNQAVLEEST